LSADVKAFVRLQSVLGELRTLRIEVKVVYGTEQMPGHCKVLVQERVVDDVLRGAIG
jgi:hypothetical protein